MFNQKILSQFSVYPPSRKHDSPNRLPQQLQGALRLMEMDSFTAKIIGCAIDVHRVLGPGLLESTYQQCFARELLLNGITFKKEHPLPVEYKGIKLDCGYRIDILADDRLIIELKPVDEIKGIHQAQLLTYMKLSDIDTGLLINFNVEKLKDGIQRFKR